MSTPPTDRFPDWRSLYEQQPAEKLPWFHEPLDPDLQVALDQLGVSAGTALDLGTGPGTQAIALARRGLEVTATDLSQAAIEQAAARAGEAGVEVSFLVDDVLDSRLEGRFEVIFDRGCFHVLPPGRRPDYVALLTRLCAPGGWLFLKCFSHEQPGTVGPYRFTPDEVREIFSPAFRAVSIQPTIYQGTLDPPPRALFCVLQPA
jgi:2-polyprenyl-3-methyl-5-hydroxy-6-metoxy-1,4-benzoquinol methylase